MNTQPLINTPPIVTAAYPVECDIAGAVWQADITATTCTFNDHTLRVEVRLLRLARGAPEQWQFWFADCAAHQVLPIGAPGNPWLTRPVKQSAFALSAGVIFEIKHSDWLPTCQPVGGAPGDLHHYVVVDDGQSLALHVAATNVIGHRLEEDAGEGDIGHRLERVAAPVSLMA